MPRVVNPCGCQIISVWLFRFYFLGKFGLLHHPVWVPSRLVSHGDFRLPPRWHFSFRVNQSGFFILGSTPRRSSYVYSMIAVRSYAICGNPAKVVDKTPGGKIKGHLHCPSWAFLEGFLLKEAVSTYGKISQFLDLCWAR